METGEVFYYDSLRTAAKELNSNHAIISSYIKSKKLFHVIYHIEISS